MSASSPIGKMGDYEQPSSRQHGSAQTDGGNGELLTRRADAPGTGGMDPVAAWPVPFDQLQPETIVRAFGVDYGHVHPPEGGDLYVTRYGWPFLNQLLPGNWYADRWYATHGEKLPGSGHVYHVATRPAGGRRIDVVVKFSRVAREVPLEVGTTFPDDIPLDVIANARFNSPMEEFGLVMEMRRGTYGPRRVRVLSQRPLAIYAPAEEYELWQLGRDHSRFHAHWHLLAEDQENRPKAIELDIKRIYVLVYSWIKGEDAEQALRAGYISEQECRDLTVIAIQDLRSNGFRVLDNKPKHFILRRRHRNRQLLRTDEARIVYGLVDFELLQRTADYQSRFKAAQREKYWHLQSRRRGALAAALPSHLQQRTVFGVDCVFGATPDGGKLWVVGHDPELFDYFLPDRWRRTPRARLSLTNEVYHTRTRDGLHVVYRRSRVGMQPRVDPLLEVSKRIREHGYNSPFEEVAIAERVRESGVCCTYPRAIYRTGHQTTKVTHLRDERRFASHAHLVTPEQPSEPVLSPDYDYYTIWGYFRGIDPVREYHRHDTFAVTDLEQVHDDGLLDQPHYEEKLEGARQRLRAVGLAVDEIEPYEFAVAVRADGTLRRVENGEADVRLCIDAQTAYEYGLMNEEDYRDLIRRLEGKLAAAGWEQLNLAGHHLLLSMNPDGKLTLDEGGQLAVVVCNFELVRTLH
jgi:hypothetical protein